MGKKAVKGIILVVLIILLAIIYLIATNISSIGQAFRAIPGDWVICIFVGIILKTVADFISKEFIRRRPKKQQSNS